MCYPSCWQLGSINSIDADISDVIRLCACVGVPDLSHQ